MEYVCGTVENSIQEAAAILQKYTGSPGIVKADYPTYHIFLEVSPDMFFKTTFNADDIEGKFPQELVTLIFGKLSEYLCKWGG